MKLWLIYANKNLPRGIDPWYPEYDKYFGFVVRAESEDQARKFIVENRQYGDEGEEAWLNAEYSTCTEVTTNGEPAVILCDFNAG